MHPHPPFAPLLAIPSHLIDIAPRGHARQSSRGKAGRGLFPQNAVGNDLTAEFAFHTARQDAPWWSLDLGEEWPLERIVIHNRRKPELWHRARLLKVEVSQDGNDWTVVHQGFVPFGGAGVGDPLTLPLNSRLLVQHIRLSLPEAGVLHLAGVQVLVRRGLMACRRIETARGFDLRRPITRFDPLDFEIPYEVEARSVDEIDGPLIGLSLRRYGRFGNNVTQTLNALHFAQVAGLGTVRLTSISGLSLTEPAPVAGLTLLPPDAPLPGGGAFLAGDFYYSRQFGGLFESFTPAARHALAHAVIRPLLLLPDVPAPPTSSEAVLHFRSGDVFSHHPHPNYGQPPLSYYQAAVTHLAAKGIDRVCLVYEDRGNPCIAALEVWLDKVAMPWRTQSATVEEDIAFLLQADHLIFGTGTFGLGICLLAGPIASVHAFDGWGLYDSLPNIAELRLGADAAGAYIASWGWTNTPDQRRLMLDYPSANLSFRKA